VFTVILIKRSSERTPIMIPGFHGADLIVILVVALLVFGPKRLPEMGSAVGKSIKEFKKGMSELTSGSKEEPKAATPTTPTIDAIERENASHRVVTETPVEVSSVSNVETPVE
jgi:sec-independent protein translocase protein TatA